MIQSQIFIDVLTIDLNQYQNRAKIQMQRSSSISAIKIDFNPRQAIVGSSSIDRLPVRKCNSTKSLSQISQISQNQQNNVLKSQQYNIDLLKRINESLQRQNAYLKKQLEFFTQTCSSKRASLNNIIGSNLKKRDDKILSRIDAKVDKNDTQSTGLFNSKMSSGKKGEQVEESISEMYTKYNLKKILPKQQTIKQITQSFLESIKQNYLKLRLIVDEFNNTCKLEKISKQTTEIISILQTVVIHSKNAKVAKNILSHNQVGLAPKATNKNKIEDIINDNLSANELISLFESLIRVGIKNSKFVTNLRSNLSFTRLVKRMAKNQ